MPDIMVNSLKNRHNNSKLLWNNHRLQTRAHVNFYSTVEAGNSSKPSPEVGDIPIPPEEASTDEANEEIIELKAQNSTLQEKIKGSEDKYVRALAETENVRQRMRKQIEDAKLFGIQGFCKDLLTVADTLRLATDNIPPEQLENKFVKNMHEGLKLTESQLLQVFSQHGVNVSNPEGEKFDPNYHEAVIQQPIPDKEPGTVFVVTKPGFTLNDRVLRPAMVGVVKVP